MTWTTAIIDRGVEKSHIRLANAEICGLTISKVGERRFNIVENDFSDSSGHGTAVASIIHRLNPATRLFSVKLDSYDDKITEDLLIRAIEWCSTQDHIKLINISLGIAVEHPSPELFEACKKASDSGKILIAAAYNYPETACYPAHFPFVYGVSTGIVREKSAYAYLGPGRINILAKGMTQRVAWVNNSFRITTGTSFATAHFTGILSGLLANRSDFTADEVQDLITAHSSNEIAQLYYVRVTRRPDARDSSLAEIETQGKRIFGDIQLSAFARKIALFPASEKEIQTIVEFRHACTLEIALFIDFPRKITKSLYAWKNYEDVSILNGEPTMEHLNSFDTLVVGYFLDQLVDTNILFGINLIRKCLSLSKNFIVWDRDVHRLIRDIIKAEFPEYAGTILFPSVEKKALQIIDDFAHLPVMRLPVLAVIGTGSMSGKVTTQLRVKELMATKGYDILHLSTEPQGILLGAGQCFPYGFKPIVDLNSEDWPPYLDILLRGIQQYRSPHLILTGMQGGIHPGFRETGGVWARTSLRSLYFLLGISPDAVICTVNPTDRPEAITQTLQMIQDFTKAQTLFCVMTPWNRQRIKSVGRPDIANYSVLSKKELQRAMQVCSDKIGKPVLDIMDAANDDKILEFITGFFTKR
jgi:hypothetical protein